MRRRLQIESFAIASAFAISTASALADHIDKAAEAIYSLQEKDEAACAKTFKSGAFTFIPLAKRQGHLTSFQIRRGKQVLLTIKPQDEVSKYWISFPVINAPKLKRSFNPQRLVADVVGMHPLRSRSPFTDLNGDGVPEVIVSSYSGGAHCCLEYEVYSLGRTAKKIADDLPGAHSECVFADLDGDGRFEAIGADWTFAYWNAGFAQSPAEIVILRSTKNGYRLAPDLMRTAPPRAAAFRAHVDECKDEIPEGLAKGESFEVTSTVWKNMLPLIYSGHSKLAWKLLDQVWPPGTLCQLDTESKSQMTKKEFRQLFLTQLNASEYWNGLKQLNKTDPILASFKPMKQKK
jgi:hypothetical protein